MGRTKAFERDEVIEKATRLFWTRGFARTSLQDLEKITGLNKSSLYREFEDKDDLFFFCLKQYSEGNPAAKILERKPLGLQNLSDFLAGSPGCARDGGCFIANSVRESAIIPKKSREFIVDHMANFSELVVANVKATGVESERATQISELIMTFNAGLALRSNIDEIKNRNQLVKSFLKAFFGDFR